MIQQVPATFSLDELLSYLREEEHTEGYRTAQEWAAHFEVNVRRMRELLGEAKKAGLLQCNMANGSASTDGIRRCRCTRSTWVRESEL